jgi:hypothetical protein
MMSAAPFDTARVATCHLHLCHALPCQPCELRRDVNASAGMELWQLQQAAPRGRDSSDAGGSRLSDGADLAAGVELGSFDGSLDLGDDSGVHRGSRHMYMCIHMNTYSYSRHRCSSRWSTGTNLVLSMSLLVCGTLRH